MKQNLDFDNLVWVQSENWIEDPRQVFLFFGKYLIQSTVEDSVQMTEDIGSGSTFPHHRLEPKFLATPIKP